MNRKKKVHGFAPMDRMLLGVVLLLLMIGVMMVYDASIVTAFKSFGDQYHFLKLQVVWVSLGLGVLFIFSRIDYHLFEKLAPLLLIVTLILLGLVLVPSLSLHIYGARRWLNLGFVSVQPSEFAKLAFAIYLAYWLSRRKLEISRKVFAVIPFMALLALIIGLVMFQPDLGTSIVIAVMAFFIYMAAGAHWGSLLLVVPPSLIAGAFFILSSSYRRHRFLAFLDPGVDVEGISYHIQQVYIALGSGGFWGRGIGQSRQKFEYLPEVMTDSIFAVLGEELGFIGAVVIIALFLFLFYRGFIIINKAPDLFGRLLGVGIVAWLSAQTFINLGAMVGVIPLTGIPLPFISYGGSSTLVVLSAVGILLNISRSCENNSQSYRQSR